jgi:hypothetical protein
MKALCHPYWFSWRVSSGPDWLAASMLLITLPSHFLLWGLQGLEGVYYSLGYGRPVGYIASSRLCFIATLLVGWLGEPRGLYPACAKYHYKAKMEPCSSVHSLSCHENCHPVREVNCGIPCVCTVGLEVFTNERSQL